MNIPIFAIIYLRHFNNLPPNLGKTQKDFQSEVEKWAVKYLRLDFKSKDFDIVKNWISVTTKNYA
jgi:hypothetical protein